MKMTKRCPKCGKVLLATTEYFYSSKTNKDHLSSSCRDCQNIYARRWQATNPAKLKEHQRRSYEKRRYDKNIWARNEDYIAYRDKKKEYCKIRCRLANNLRSRIIHALQRNTKSKSTRELVGCNWDVLKMHLALQFKPDMTWGNYGRNGWEVDHIRPCVSFNLADPEQQKRCFHYTNLQPLWAKENHRKHAELKV